MWVISIPSVHHNYDPFKQGKSQYALHCVDPLIYEQSPVFLLGFTETPYVLLEITLPLNNSITAPRQTYGIYRGMHNHQCQFSGINRCTSKFTTFLRVYMKNENP